MYTAADLKLMSDVYVHQKNKNKAAEQQVTKKLARFATFLFN